MSSNCVELLVRGDDCGGSFSANRAIAQGCREGVIRNVSVMAIGPAVEQVAEALAGCDGVCLGLHTTLNSEWLQPRFGPVLPAGEVASLVDRDGIFLPSPRDLEERGFSLEEAEREVRAQLKRLRSLGLAIDYLDEHMIVGRAGGLAERLSAICREEGLVHARHNAVNLPHVSPPPPVGTTTADERVRLWIDRINAAPPGRYVLAMHPLCDDEESRAIYRKANPPGTVALDRDRDRQAVLDPRLAAIVRSPRVKLVRYTDPSSF